MIDESVLGPMKPYPVWLGEGTFFFLIPNNRLETN